MPRMHAVSFITERRCIFLPSRRKANYGPDAADGNRVSISPFARVVDS